MLKEKLFNLTAVIFLGFFTFSLLLISQAKSQSSNLRVKSHLQFDKKFSGKVYVIDGDSIKVGDKEVRLFGIDAPEYAQTCFDEQNQEYACGKISREFLVNFISDKIVDCSYAEKDKYDRFLGKCEIDKMSINDATVKNGMAVIYNFNESEAHLETLEKAAKDQKIGIWKGAFQLPKDYRKAHPRTN